MGGDLDRRGFLRVIAGLPFLIPGPTPSARSAPGRSVVARARRAGTPGEPGTPGGPGGGGPAGAGAPDAVKAADALGAALSRAAGEDRPVAALRRLFKPSDVVGLKLNTLGGRGLAPGPPLVKRLTDWLQEAGVPARNIVVFDRTDRELIGAGFAIARSGPGVRCFGVNQDWDWEPREWGPGGSCFARILVNDLTALVNIGVLKDHDLAGVSAGLKNWYGVINNPNKHHDDNCAPFIPHLAAYPLIRDRLRLTIVDATSAQYHGGPARNPKWRWPLETVLASTDPVAIDAVGWRMIEARRKEAGLPSLAGEKREPRFIAGAAGLGLGEADPARITIEDV